MTTFYEENINIPPSRLLGLEGTFARVSKKIAVGDGMKPAGTDGAHYFGVGASAISAIRSSLDAVGRSSTQVKSVLDYACGYGRVLRWLSAYFEGAKVIGLDADEKAALAAGVVTGVETRKLDISLTQPLGYNFDVIWVGSLFTHLPKSETARVLRYLNSALAPDGIIVFTTHGELVSRRLALRERNYNLEEDSISGLLKQLSNEGYGYADYPKQNGYGISVSTPSAIIQLVEDIGMSAVYFRSAGWANHQDVFAATPSTRTSKT